MDPRGSKMSKNRAYKSVGNRVVQGLIGANLALFGLLALGCQGSRLDAPTDDSQTLASTQQALTLAEQAASSGHRILGYFTQWAIYGGHGNYDACDVPLDRYTHINYAFVGVRDVANPAFNPAVSTKSADYADDFKWLKTLDYHADEGHTNCNGREGVSISYEGENAGNVGWFRQAKQSRPWLKFMISFGGWTKGAGFPVVASDATRRNEFCDDVVRIVRRWDADGADFDWEFPGESRAPDPNDSNDEGMPHGSAADTANFTELLRVCRAKLDAAGTADGKSYELTAAVSAGKSKLDKIQWSTINSEGLLDHVYLMTYDYHGAFDTSMAGHQSSLYASANDGFPAPINTEFNVDFSFNYLTAVKGMPPGKVSIGMAFYTRGWGNVTPGTGVDLDGNGTKDGLFGSITGNNPALAGDWGPGGQNGLNKIFTLKGQTGWEELWDDSAKAHVLYNRSQNVLYTYDSVRSVEEKTNYCLSKGCGGMFNWEIDGDATVGGESYPLITRAAELLSAGGQCTPTTCAAHGAICGTVSDGCGNTLDCGTCSGGATCSNHQCVVACTPDCTGKVCGDDGCGGSCGGCAAGELCDVGQCVPDGGTGSGEGNCAGVTAWDANTPWTSYTVSDLRTDGGRLWTCTNVAYCIYEPSGANGHWGWQDQGECDDGDPQCTPTTCAAAGATCGSIADGCGGTLNCGSCAPGHSCVANQCEAICAPASCASLGASCGTPVDGCGGTLNCGSCGAGELCSAANQCVPTCTPATCASVGAQCGSVSDGCGGTLDCGTCGANEACDAANQCVSTCTPATCASVGAQCGSVSDGCGGTLDCGSCGSGQSCNASNQCESSGNCGAPGWSSSVSYSAGSIVVSNCTYQHLACGAADMNQTFAWQCTAIVPAWCSSFEPGSAANYNGVWTKLEQCSM